MNKRNAFVIKALATYLVAGVLSALVMWIVYPADWGSITPVMEAFFVTAGVLVTFLFAWTTSRNVKRANAVYMFSRMIKMALAIIFMALCLKLGSWDKRPLLTALIVFYLMFMIADLYVYFIFNKINRTNGV